MQTEKKMNLSALISGFSYHLQQFTDNLFSPKQFPALRDYLLYFQGICLTLVSL